MSFFKLESGHGADVIAVRKTPAMKAVHGKPLEIRTAGKPVLTAETELDETQFNRF